MPTAAAPAAVARGSAEGQPKAPVDRAPTDSVAQSSISAFRSEISRTRDPSSTSSAQSVAKKTPEKVQYPAASVADGPLPVSAVEIRQEKSVLPPAADNGLKRAVKDTSTPVPGVSAQRAESPAQKRSTDSNQIAPASEAVRKPPLVKKTAAPAPPSEVSVTLPLPGVRKVEQKGKLKNSTQRAEPNGKSQTQAPSLGTRFKRWLNPTTPISSDRRRAYRRYVPGMVAHYYTGGAPKPHDIADISMTGFYLLTEDRWMPDTMIQMTLQKPCARGERKQSIMVLSKIVRLGSDGVAAEFVMPESLDPHSHDVRPSQTTDRFALARFL